MEVGTKVTSVSSMYYRNSSQWLLSLLFCFPGGLGSKRHDWRLTGEYALHHDSSETHYAECSRCHSQACVAQVEWQGKERFIDHVPSEIRLTWFRPTTW
jgi:hypothetical protein